MALVVLVAGCSGQSVGASGSGSTSAAPTRSVSEPAPSSSTRATSDTPAPTKKTPVASTVEAARESFVKAHPDVINQCGNGGLKGKAGEVGLFCTVKQSAGGGVLVFFQPAPGDDPGKAAQRMTMQSKIDATFTPVKGEWVLGSNNLKVFGQAYEDFTGVDLGL